MKNLFFLILLVAGFGIKSGAQTVTNNTSCPFTLNIQCLDPNTCVGTGVISTYTVNPGAVQPIIPNCGALTLLHFVTIPSSCSVFDPFIGMPGGPCGYPVNDVMEGSCACRRNNVVYVGGQNWQVNP